MDIKYSFISEAHRVHYISPTEYNFNFCLICIFKPQRQLKLLLHCKRYGRKRVLHLQLMYTKSSLFSWENNQVHFWQRKDLLPKCQKVHNLKYQCHYSYFSSSLFKLNSTSWCALNTVISKGQRHSNKLIQTAGVWKDGTPMSCM